MQTKSIVFTAPKTAELLMQETKPVTDDLVAVRMEYTVVSGGTERANIMAMPNAGGGKFPKQLGYCGVGHVIEVGPQVTDLAIGQRVLVYHGNHTEVNVVRRIKVTPVTQENLDSVEAAFVIIAAMGLGGVRRLQLELGESAMVMGLGLLGIFALQFLRQSGAYPVIAADLNPERRALALQLGADYAFDPAAPDFVEQVKAVTGKGVNATVEVSGNAKALLQALNCAAREGRISLLGCTRISDVPIDFYQQVHRPGIKLIGAHNFVRPLYESRPHEWTHQDDCKAILALLNAGRIQVKPIISRVVKPEQAPEIYTQLCDDPAFPMGTVFDWRDTTC